MKKIFFLLILLIFSCQKASDQTKINRPKTTSQKGAIPESLEIPSQYLTCEQYFQDLVSSSNLQAFKSYRDVFVRIENRSSTKITLELYVVNNVSEKVGEVRNTERTVSWLEFFPASKHQKILLKINPTVNFLRPIAKKLIIKCCPVKNVEF